MKNTRRDFVKNAGALAGGIVASGLTSCAGILSTDRKKTDIRIDPIEAKAKVDRGEALILDVVAPDTWATMPRTIRGAVRIAPDQVAQRADELSSGREVIAT